MQLRFRLIFFLIPVFVVLFSTGLFAQFENTTLEVQYDSFWVYKNLKLIPVRFQSRPDNAASIINKDAKIISLADAVRDHKIRISELPKNVGADVSVLKLINESKDYIMINSGEVVVGGKQDRAAGETVLLPPVKEDFFLKSYCVEKGRWSKKEKGFTYFGPAELSVKKNIDIEKNQAHVWNEIERDFKSHNLASETLAYPEFLSVNRSVDDSGYIKFFTSKFNASDSGYAGFIAVTGNRIIATDLYASSQLTANAFPAILYSYVRFAVNFGGQPITITDDDVRKFMEPVLSDEKTRRAFLVRHGTIHYYQRKPFHIVAYGD